MNLHLPTLLFFSIYTLVLLGILMLHAWRRSVGEPSLACMAGMFLLAAVGTLVVSLRGMGIDTQSIVLGNALLLLACAMGWLAMRLFVGRRPVWPAIAAGAVLWLALCLWPYFMATVSLRVAVSCLGIILYAVLAGWELWCARRRLEVSVVPTLSILSVHVTFFSVRLVFDRGEGLALMWSSIAGNFYNWVILESLLYAIGITITTLAMVRERSESRLRGMANSDALTGIGNRRAFMDRASRALGECEEQRRPATLLLCDLDDFKQLNDSWGHAVGDEALIAFAALLERGVRKQDICGRIGGEEFACLLPNTDSLQAVKVAERIRRSCSELPIGVPQALTVSIGLAASCRDGYALKSLLNRADAALYRAKDCGRNRVEQSGRAEGAGADGEEAACPMQQ